MSDVTAITLTDEERLAILNYWGSPEEFAAWQRSALADEILRRAQIVAQSEARQMIDSASVAAQETFPTLFSDAAADRGWISQDQADQILTPQP